MALIDQHYKKIKLIGDKSLSKRDFSRVTWCPLKKFGAKFGINYKIENKLPLKILGIFKFRKAINYFENKGSAQCKSSVMFAALNTSGSNFNKS